MQFMKMTWMGFWRIFAIMIILGIANVGTFFLSFIVSAITAAIIRVNFWKSVYAFPILRKLLAKRAIRVHFTPNLFDIGERAREQKFAAAQKNPRNVSQRYQRGHSLTPYDSLPFISQPSNQTGKLTGWEPQHLKNIPLPTAERFEKMEGTPGSGLENSGFRAESIASGRLGEENFAKVLSKIEPTGHLIENDIDINATLRYGASFWSVAMPSAESPHRKDEKYQTDIDAVLVHGNHMLLVDLKMYRSGDVTYKASGQYLYCIDNATGSVVGDPVQMSQNMRMAQERFAKHFPTMEVNALVIFMPTNHGAPNVDGLEWYGGIPVMGLQDALAHIGELCRRGRAHAGAVHKLSKLVHRNSTPPRNSTKQR